MRYSKSMDVYLTSTRILFLVTLSTWILFLTRKIGAEFQGNHGQRNQITTNHIFSGEDDDDDSGKNPFDNLSGSGQHGQQSANAFSRHQIHRIAAKEERQSFHKHNYVIVPYSKRKPKQQKGKIRGNCTSEASGTSGSGAPDVSDLNPLDNRISGMELILRLLHDKVLSQQADSGNLALALANSQAQAPIVTPPPYIPPPPPPPLPLPGPIFIAAPSAPTTPPTAAAPPQPPAPDYTGLLANLQANLDRIENKVNQMPLEWHAANTNLAGIQQQSRLKNEYMSAALEKLQSQINCLGQSLGGMSTVPNGLAGMGGNSAALLASKYPGVGAPASFAPTQNAILGVPAPAIAGAFQNAASLMPATSKLISAGQAVAHQSFLNPLGNTLYQQQGPLALQAGLGSIGSPCGRSLTKRLGVHEKGAKKSVPAITQVNMVDTPELPPEIWKALRDADKRKEKKKRKKKIALSKAQALSIPQAMLAPQLPKDIVDAIRASEKAKEKKKKEKQMKKLKKEEKERKKSESRKEKAKEGVKNQPDHAISVSNAPVGHFDPQTLANLIQHIATISPTDFHQHQTDKTYAKPSIPLAAGPIIPGISPEEQEKIIKLVTASHPVVEETSKAPITIPSDTAANNMMLQGNPLPNTPVNANVPQVSTTAQAPKPPPHGPNPYEVMTSDQLFPDNWHLSKRQKQDTTMVRRIRALNDNEFKKINAHNGKEKRVEVVQVDPLGYEKPEWEGGFNPNLNSEPPANPPALAPSNAAPPPPPENYLPAPPAAVPLEGKVDKEGGPDYPWYQVPTPPPVQPSQPYAPSAPLPPQNSQNPYETLISAQWLQTPDTPPGAPPNQAPPPAAQGNPTYEILDTKPGGPEKDEHYWMQIATAPTVKPSQPYAPSPPLPPKGQTNPYEILTSEQMCGGQNDDYKCHYGGQGIVSKPPTGKRRVVPRPRRHITQKTETSRQQALKVLMASNTIRKKTHLHKKEGGPALPDWIGKHPPVLGGEKLAPSLGGDAEGEGDYPWIGLPPAKMDGKTDEPKPPPKTGVNPYEILTSEQAGLRKAQNKTSIFARHLIKLSDLSIRQQPDQLRDVTGISFSKNANDGKEGPRPQRDRTSTMNNQFSLSLATDQHDLEEQEEIRNSRVPVVEVDRAPPKSNVTQVQDVTKNKSKIALSSSPLSNSSVSPFEVLTSDQTRVQKNQHDLSVSKENLPNKEDSALKSGKKLADAKTPSRTKAKAVRHVHSGKSKGIQKDTSNSAKNSPYEVLISEQIHKRSGVNNNRSTEDQVGLSNSAITSKTGNIKSVKGQKMHSHVEPSSHKGIHKDTSHVARYNPYEVLISEQIHKRNRANSIQSTQSQVELSSSATPYKRYKIKRLKELKMPSHVHSPSHEGIHKDTSHAARYNPYEVLISEQIHKRNTVNSSKSTEDQVISLSSLDSNSKRDNSKGSLRRKEDFTVDFGSFAPFKRQLNALKTKKTKKNLAVKKSQRNSIGDAINAILEGQGGKTKLVPSREHAKAAEQDKPEWDGALVNLKLAPSPADVPGAEDKADYPWLKIPKPDPVDPEKDLPVPKKGGVNPYEILTSEQVKGLELGEGAADGTKISRRTNRKKENHSSLKNTNSFKRTLGRSHRLIGSPKLLQQINRMKSLMKKSFHHRKRHNLSAYFFEDRKALKRPQNYDEEGEVSARFKMEKPEERTAFLIDTSSLAAKKHLEDVKRFLQSYIKSESGNNTKVAIVSYGAKTKIVQKFSDNQTKEQTLAAIQKLSPSEGRPNLDKALEFTISELMLGSVRDYLYTSSKMVMLINEPITKQEKENIKKLVDKMVHLGIKRFVIGLGKQFNNNKDALELLSSYPMGSYVITTNYSALARMGKLMGAIIKGHDRRTTFDFDPGVTVNHIVKT